MCYEKVTPRKAFRKKMHQLTENFIKDVTSMENQDDSEDINNVASTHMENVNNFLMDAVEDEYRSQNQAFLRGEAIANADARDPISELWKEKLKNRLSCYLELSFFNDQQPRSETTILEKALDVWEYILKSVKEFWQKLLDWLKEKIAALKNFLVSVWERVQNAVKLVLEWF